MADNDNLEVNKEQVVEQNQEVNKVPLVGADLVQPTAPNEKMLPQSQVDAIVKSVKYETQQKVLRDIQKQQQAAPVGDPSHNLTDEQIRKIANEEAEKRAQEAQRLAQEEYAQRVIKDFQTKLENGKGKYNDFDASVSNLNLAVMPNVVHLANLMDNTADIMYYLAKNPVQADIIERSAYLTRDNGMSLMKQFSDSIKQNQQPAQKTPNEPLSQIRPSTTGTDNGSLSIADLKKKYRG